MNNLLNLVNIWCKKLTVNIMRLLRLPDSTITSTSEAFDKTDIVTNKAKNEGISKYTLLIILITIVLTAIGVIKLFNIKPLRK